MIIDVIHDVKENYASIIITALGKPKRKKGRLTTGWFRDCYQEKTYVFLYVFYFYLSAKGC